jgi:hypothetical protein
MVTRKKVAAAAKRAAKRMAVAADVALVEAGEAAKQRQRGRALKAVLRTTGKAAAIAAAAVATVIGARAAMRARRGRAAPTTT